MKVWLLFARHKGVSSEKLVGVYDSEEKMNAALKHIQSLLPSDLLEFSASVSVVK